MKKIHVVSFSGGKDSTAMLLKMIELDMQIDYIVFADTGMEFPEMYRHIEKIEKYINRKITKVRSNNDYLYYMFEHEKTKGKRKGEKGYMWMDWRSRWCTSELKQKPIRAFYKSIAGEGVEIIEYHGIAIDEKHRIEKNKSNKRTIVYPLIDLNMTESDALELCYEKGFNWEGLYNNFSRLSCYMCPLQRLSELKIVYFKYPKLWEHMKVLDEKNIKLYNRQFRTDYSISELEDKFEKEVNNAL